MPHAVHKLTQVGTLVRRELVTGVAQVVKMNRWKSGRAESRVPDATAEVAAPQRLALRAGEGPRPITSVTAEAEGAGR